MYQGANKCLHFLQRNLSIILHTTHFSRGVHGDKKVAGAESFYSPSSGSKRLEMKLMGQRSALLIVKFEHLQCSGLLTQWSVTIYCVY